MNPFEIVKGWEDKEINLPKRKTAFSAGYDIECAADIVVPSYHKIMQEIGYLTFPLTLDKVAKITK